jgi:hypothetical protein
MSNHASGVPHSFKPSLQVREEFLEEAEKKGWELPSRYVDTPRFSGAFLKDD